MENLFDKTTQLWVKLTGRRIDENKHKWLFGPIGGTDFIADKFVTNLAEAERLDVLRNEENSGLLSTMSDIGLSKHELKRLSPAISDFYTKTANYTFEFWSEWAGLFKPFGKLLSIIFSKRLQQLNLPISAMDASKGIDSQIIKLNKGGETKWTVWFRTLKATKKVIYSGVYTSCTPSKYVYPLLKVVFPLPNGNASVIMTHQVKEDGSLLLSSDGKKFGDNGFYFFLTNHKGKYWARYVRAMHEWIHVYVDEEGHLRADHNLNFYGLRFLNLHYLMREKEVS